MTPDQVADYERDGYAVLDGFVPVAECERVRARALELVDAWEPSDQRTVFTTNDQTRVSNEEFLRSGHGIWCFFEEDAIDPDGSLRCPKSRAINKIGHALHDLDDEFERFSYRSSLAAVAAAIGQPEPLAVQSMYIFKQPRIGGEVGCHQDATFLYGRAGTVTGFWFAIEDATLQNGCLWVAPGGHHGPLRERMVRVPSGDSTRFIQLDDTPLPSPPPLGSELVPLEVSAGTLVVLHGLLPHWSGPNRSSVSRHAYSLHCISPAAHYAGDNWLQRPPGMPFRHLADVPR